MSSAKTTNYIMHKWVGNDSPFREEFNDNFEKIDNEMKSHATSLADIVSIKKHTTTQELQTYFNNIPNNTHVQLKGTFELDNVIVISNKKHLKIDLNDAYFHNSKHGYGIFEFVNCSNIKIDGGEFEGAGNFYPNTFANGELNNEKQKCRNEWGMYRNGQLSTYEDWNNGKLGNFGIGILIHNNCKNFKVKRIKSHHFNGSGISVGFIGDGYHAEDIVNYCENILISSCECHDNFDCGIQTLQDISTRIENCDIHDNGHPNAIITDTNIDPGYGIAIRGNLFCSEKTLVYNNRCYNNKRKGLDAHAGKDFIFNNNIVSDSFYCGIGVTGFGSNPIGDYQILNNTLYNCGNANTYEKFGILADGANITGVIKGNKLYNCAYNASLTTNNVAINTWKGTKIIEDNIIVNSGINYPISASQGLDYLTIKNNKIITSTCEKAINLENEVVNPTKFVDVCENNISITTGKGISFIYVNDGKCENNSFKTSLQELEFVNSSILIGNNKGISNMDYAKYKANGGITKPTTYFINVKITSGAITFTDFSGIVASVVDLDKGIRINLKRTLLGNCVITVADSSTNNSYQNIYQRASGTNYIDIGIGVTLTDAGQPSTSITNLMLNIAITTL